MRKIDDSGSTRVDRHVERTGARQVVAERLLDDDAGAVGASRLAELRDDAPEQRRAESRGSGSGVRAPPSAARNLVNVAGSV